MTQFLLLSLLMAPGWAQDADAPVEPEVEVPAEPAPETPESTEQPPPADEPDAEEDEDADVDLVIEVIGEAAVDAARDDVVRTMEDLGWKARRKRGGHVVFRGPEAWMGKAHLYSSGDIHFTTPVLAINGPRETGGNDGVSRGFDNDAQSGTVGISVAPLPAGRKVRSAQAEIRETVQPLVLEYRKKIQGRHFAVYIGSIPERLDALWENGESFLGAEGTVDGMDARRAEVLEFWGSRLDSPEGRVVSRTVENWIRNVVQNSDHPVTASEKAEAESHRKDGRLLDI